ncbi:hypothetical protein M422DRAFT_265532 [Sphaerobolus stellatus SS14]|uniref:Uncharacterized protein n=1 Tax=Sphaerobolus stellatus (strain SS14) TaxID=990650 RepID=A0A0C9UTS4_SPHS4|nr:hypothetical protein M422DRAFT_265532 [Sphaerobolus stellatus SS14]
MGRPVKYAVPGEAHLARLKSKKEYYQRNIKNERKKALERYVKGKAMGKKRTPSTEVKHRKHPQPASAIVTESPVPALQITSKTILRTAIKQVWNRILPGGGPADFQRVLESRFSNLLEECSNEIWATMRPKLIAEITRVDAAIREASEILQEGRRRDPADKQI